MYRVTSCRGTVCTYCMVGARTKKDVEMKLSQADCRSGEVLYMSSSSTWRCSKPPGVAESNSQKQDRCNVQGVRGEVCSCDSLIGPDVT